MKRTIFTLALFLFSISVFSQTNYYVNDNSTAGDVFTTAIGSDSNPGTPAAPFATISYALSQATANSIIYIDAGTYVEQVTVDKGITLYGAGMDVTSILPPSITVSAPGTFTEKGVIQTNQSLTSDVHLRNLSVTGDYNIGLTPVILQTGGSIENCKMVNGNQGIYIRIDQTINPGTKFAYLANNIINAEYIGVNYDGVSLIGYLVDNTITATNPGFSAGVFVGQGFGSLSQFNATGNKISGYVTAGIYLNSNTSAINQNSIAGVNGFAIQRTGGTNTPNASCNWYGSATKANVSTKISGTINYAPWFIDGTDNSAAQGFQHAGEICPGGADVYYVNDNSTTGDVFTTNVGNDANPGTPTAPLATLSAALTKAQPGNIILVDAGTYNNIGVVINKSISILGTNYMVSPNSAADPLQPNAGRNAESVITNSSFTIGASNITFNGFNFDPQANSQFNQPNNSLEYDNITIAKNIFHINSASPSITMTGKQVFPLVTANYDINDNRFIKEDASVSPTSNCIALTGIDSCQVRNNTFTVSSAANARKQTAILFDRIFRTGNAVITNNIAYQMDRFVAGGNAKSLTVQYNKTIEDNRFAIINNTIPDPCEFIVSGNNISDDKTNATSIGYSRGNGVDLSSPNIFRAERNVININVTGTNFCPQSLIAPTVNPNTPDVRIFINENKLKYKGSFISYGGISVSGIRLWQRMNQATLQNNEISFEGTDVTSNSDILGIYLIHLGLQPGASYQVLNNKVSGYKTSFYVQLDQGGTGGLPDGVSVDVHNNSFTGDIMSIDNGTLSNTINASCNWYGSSADQEIINKLSMGTISALPWLTNGTDNDTATGFQPAEDACDGYPPLIVLDSFTNVTCNGANNGTIHITTTYGKAPFTYTWTKDGDAGFISHDEDPNNLAPGTYHLSVVDGNGSSIFMNSIDSDSLGSIIVTITEPPVLTAITNGTNASCFGGTNGSIAVSVNGGTAPYSYLWSNNETTQNISNLSAGTYTVTVTDANGCTVQASYEVTQPAQLTAIATGVDVNCFGGSDGSVQLNVSGGTPSYTYLWNNNATTPSLTDLSAGIYSVTVTDANSCFAIINYEVKQPEALTVSVTGTKASCNGSATANPSGGTAPYSYLWNNGSTSQSISNVPAGTYSVTVKDSHNCSVSGSFTITGGSPINPTTSLVQVSCFGQSDGSITVTGTNSGAAPFTYNLNGSAFQAGSVFNNLSAGVYVLGVKDANGCSDFVTRTITQPVLLTIELDSLKKPCYATNNGRIYITAKGGNAGKSYSWTGPNGYTSTAQDINNIGAGTYNVTVTDSKGCAASLQVELSESPAINITEGISNVACRGDLSGAIDATITGGTGNGFVFTWTGPNSFTATTEDINGLKAGNYKITVTDNGSACFVQKTITITQPDSSVTLATTKTNVTGCNSLGTITATGRGGVAPYQYSLNGTNYQSSGFFAGLYGGSYNVWVKDANGCTNFKVVAVSDLGKDEFEGNNSKGQAKLISIGTVINARIAQATDVADWFKIVTPAGANVYTLTLTHSSASFVFDLYPTGTNTPALTPESSTTTTKTYTLSENTTYYISVTGGLSFECYNLLLSAQEVASRSRKNTQIAEEPASVLKAVPYPNPHQGQFTLRIESPEDGIALIQLFSIDGKLLLEKNKPLVKGNSNTIYFNNVKQGMILYRVSIGKHNFSGKITGSK